SGGARLRDIAPADLGADGIGLAVTTSASGIRVALASRISAAGMGNRNVRLDDDRITESASVRVKEGEPLAFDKRVAVYSSRDGDAPETRAQAALRELAKKPLAEVI